MIVFAHFGPAGVLTHSDVSRRAHPDFPLGRHGSAGAAPAAAPGAYCAGACASWGYRGVSHRQSPVLSECRYGRGEFDFGDEADFRHGVNLMVEIGRKRYSRGRPYQMAIARQTFGVRSILYRLKAKIDVTPLAEADIAMTGWDRSDYAHNDRG